MMISFRKKNSHLGSRAGVTRAIGYLACSVLAAGLLVGLTLAPVVAWGRR